MKNRKCVVTRPTPKQIAKAREWFTPAQLEALRGDKFEQTSAMIETLLAATEPPTDAEIYASAKPDVNHHEDSYLSGWFDSVRHFFGTCADIAAELARTDPAKLAELLASALRARGVDAVALHMCDSVDAYVKVYWSKQCSALSVYVNGKRNWTCQLSDHALLGCIMATPPDASRRDEVLRIVQGAS